MPATRRQNRDPNVARGTALHPGRSCGMPEAEALPSARGALHWIGQDGSEAIPCLPSRDTMIRVDLHFMRSLTHDYGRTAPARNGGYG